METKVLVVGASGQIGTELVSALRKKYGKENVVAGDIKNPKSDSSLLNGHFELLDVLDKEGLLRVVEKYGITDVYLLAALLSATAEKNPSFGWELNMTGLFNVLDLAKENKVKKVFWPSSIAVFGATTPRNDTPQRTIMEPTTVYGISKLAGERWCEYYHKNYGVDVRSVRYPGIISYGALPGGGTTDYAVDIFYKAKAHEKFVCFLDKDMELPMMFMEDAIDATLKLMDANSSDITIRSSYNIAALSFTPHQLFESIRQIVKYFEIEYKPDYRQAIASTWPASINDEVARKDWGWRPKFDLEKMTRVMLENINPDLAG